MSESRTAPAGRESGEARTILAGCVTGRAASVSGAWTALAVEVARDWRGGRELAEAAIRAAGPGAGWRDPVGWIGWEAFARVVGVVAERLDGPREWFRFGRQMGMPESQFSRATRFSVSPARLTARSMRDLPRRLIPAMRAHWHQSRPPTLQFELSLPLQGRLAEAFFWITAGQAAVVPVALGLPESLVDVRCKGDSALLDITLPPSGTLAARAGRLLVAGLSLRRSSATLAVREYELVRAHQALGSLTRDFRQIVDTSPHGIVIQSASGELLYANAAFARSVGLDEAAAVAGRKLAELVAIDGVDNSDGALNSPGLPIVGRDAAVPPLSLRGRLLTPERWGEEVFLEVAGAQAVVFDDQPGRLVFCRDITQRRRLEREVVQASEDERRRVAMELHDGLGQLLAALSMQAQTLGLRLQANRGQEDTGSATVSTATVSMAGAQSAATELSATAQEALALARTLARGLAPVAKFDGGLPFALERLAARVPAASALSVSVEVDLPDDFAGTGEEIDLHCYRIAQEALHNVIRHADASEATIVLKLEPDGRRIRLSVTDNGRGMHAEAGGEIDGDAGGIGIRAMHYRAASIGGSLEIDAAPTGVGSRISLTVPLPSSGSPAGVDRASMDEKLTDLPPPSPSVTPSIS